MTSRLSFIIGRWSAASTPIFLASCTSAPGPMPNIARPRVMWSSMHHPVGEDERVVVGQGHDAGAEADMAGALGGGGDEHLGRGDDLEPAGMMLADPGLVIAEPVEVLDELEVALDGEGRIFLERVEGREEDAAAQIGLGHGRDAFAGGTDDNGGGRAVNRAADPPSPSLSRTREKGAVARRPGAHGLYFPNT